MNAQWRSPAWLQLFFWLVVVLIIPIIPFLAFGWFLEPKIELWLASCRQWPALVASVALAALISDIFLPIPSSFVCTTVGQILGIFPATMVCTLGFQIGAWFGWGFGRRWGAKWVESCCGQETRQMGSQVLEKWGVWAIAFTRPIPLLAETVVLLLGTHHDPFSRWFPTLLLSNASMALIWCSLGYWSQTRHLVLLASIISVLVPIGVLTFIHCFARSRKVIARNKRP